MKDWDFGNVRLAETNINRELVIKMKSLGNEDARSGTKYISVKQAREICRACDDFFRRRGMWVWDNRFNIIHNKKEPEDKK